MLKISSLDIAGNCASLGFTTKQWLCFLMSFDSNSKENIYDQVLLHLELFFNWLFSSASQIIEKQEEIVQLCNQSNEGGQVRAIEDVVQKCLYSVHVVQILSCLKQYSNSQIWHIIFQQQKLHLIHLQWLLMNLFIFSPPQSTRDNAMRLFSFLLSCVVAARWFQPAGFRSGLSAAHMPTHREDRKAAGSQPPAAEADLQPAEERQDDQDQRGARSFLPLLMMVVGVQCTLYSYSRLLKAATYQSLSSHHKHFRCKKGKISNESREKKSLDPQHYWRGPECLPYTFFRFWGNIDTDQLTVDWSIRSRSRSSEWISSSISLHSLSSCVLHDLMVSLSIWKDSYLLSRLLWRFEAARAKIQW